MRKKWRNILVIMFLPLLLFTMFRYTRVSGARQGVSQGTQTMYWDHYHNYSELVTYLLQLNLTKPQLVDVFQIGTSWQNRKIYCVRLTNKAVQQLKPSVLFIGRHHAREPITTELCLYFIDYMVSNFEQNQTVSRMLNSTEIYIIPSLNVDGMELIKQNDWQTKNARPTDEDHDGRIDEDPPVDMNGDGKIEYLMDTHTGNVIRWEGYDHDGDGLIAEDWIGGVDLNRNYGYAWNVSAESGSPNPQDEDYRGPAPFSEPETQAVRDLAMQYDFRYAISLHSGADLILYPWGYSTNVTKDDAKFRQLSADMSALTGTPYEQSSQLYTTSGLWDDWMYGNQSIPAFTFEMFNNNSAWTYSPGPDPNTEWVGGILQAFNPLPSGILNTIHKWMPALLYTINRSIIEFLPGDVNHDGKVDILDVVALTSIYASKTGDTNWNPKLDLRRDGIINILDVILCTSHYGQKLP
jgi:hypothetical protein